MKLNINSTRNNILQPSWTSVRKIYKKLSDEFQTLTNSFNIKIEEDTKRHLDHLIIAIDEIDTCIDDLPSKEERDSITESLITFLKDENKLWRHPKQTINLSIKIQNLKLVVQELGIEEDFIFAARTIFYYTEQKRHTTNVQELIDYVCLEGKATAILPLSIMGISRDDQFGVFFSKLCMIMGVADLIFDARRDYKKGYILLKPNFNLFYKLFKITIKDGCKLLLTIPRKVQFTKYCFRFTLALLKR